jgi:RNA polymerase sigma-70 factor (ECF subfamily)
MFWRTAVDGSPASVVAEEFGTTSAAVRQAKARVLRRLKEAVGDVCD